MLAVFLVGVWQSTATGISKLLDILPPISSGNHYRVKICKTMGD